MKKKSCCFTGHRNLPVEELPVIKKRLIEELETLIQKGVMYFYAGGALGFDTLAAIAVIKLKQKYPQIRLHLILPHKQQSKNWSSADKYIYERLLAKADATDFIAESYYHGCMHIRNHSLVNQSQYCICYLSDYSTGTASTVKYAIEKELQIINIANH